MYYYSTKYKLKNIFWDKALDKSSLRKELIAKRDALGIDPIRKASGIIFDKLASLDAFKRAKTVMTYVSFGSEVETHRFIAQLLAAGKTAVTPVCDKGRSMIAALTAQFPQGFEKNGFGILEIPKEQAVAVDPRAIDLIVVPCVAYAASGYRLGYGGGYYDRFLPRLRPDAVTAGVVMEELLVDAVPIGAYDVKTKIVLTQARCCFTGGDQWE